MKETTVFVKYFGETPFIRVLDFFIDNYLFDYSISDVSKELNISRVTATKVFKKILKLGLIKFNRSVGKSKMYILNRDNEAVKELIKLDMKISTISIDKPAKAIKGKYKILKDE